MKKLYLIIIRLFVGPLCPAGDIQKHQMQILQQYNAATAAGFSCNGELLCEDFEGNDTCANLGWSVGGTTDCQATDQKIDSYSFKATNGTSYIYKAVTASDTIFVKGNYRHTTDASGDAIRINNGSTQLGKLITQADGKLSLYHGSVGPSTGVAHNENTWYTVKLKWVKDPGGGNGEIYLWFAEGTDQSLSTDTGSADASLTNGNATSQASRIVFIVTVTDVAHFDNVEATATDPDA